MIRVAALVALSILVAASYFGAYSHGKSVKDSEWRERWSLRDAADKQAWALQEQDARAAEQAKQAIADEEDRKNHERYADLESRAADAESVSDSLRGEIARLRNGRSATCDTIATQQRQAATSTVDLLGQLLAESDRMAGEFGQALERSRLAGLSCERIMDSLKSDK